MISEERNIENEDVIHQWEPLKFNINENYKYVPNGIIFKFFSNLLYYGIAFPILFLILKIRYDLKIEGKENIKNLKNGAISVSNHVLILDCAMVGIACVRKKIFFTTREGSFKIPFVRKLIRLLRAIPIPKDIKNKEHFIMAVDKLLKDNKIVHFYPEAALWPFCEKLRNFKKGAFGFAIRNNVPILPIVITFRKPKGIRKILKIEKDVTLKILPPIYGDECKEKSQTERESELKEKVYLVMKEHLK